MKSRGAGGDWRWILPICVHCDWAWETFGRETTLRLRFMTWDDVTHLLAKHHERAIAAGIITRTELEEEA